MLFESAVADDSFLQFPLLYQRWWKRLRELLIAPLPVSPFCVVGFLRLHMCLSFAMGNGQESGRLHNTNKSLRFDKSNKRSGTKV
jgi:hypothetical protein